MAYIDIKNLVVSHTGTTDASQAAYIKSLINRAAEDLYTQVDLVNCFREQAFVREDPTQDNGQTVCQWTLPHYVWKIRGLREYNTGLAIDAHDMHPRYQTQGWKEFIDPFLYRIKQEQVLIRDIANEGRMKFTLPDGVTLAAGEEFSVYVTGSNSSKARFNEQVSFVAGDTQRYTTNLFSTIEAIRKTRQSAYDLSLYDASDNKISFIPNCELSPAFSILQSSDDNFWNPQYIEVLYKLKFYPFAEDYDEFPCGNIYDTALYFKTLEYYYNRKGELEKAKEFYTKVTDLCTNIAQNFNYQTEKLLDFGYNQYLGMLPSTLSNTPMNPYWRYVSKWGY